MRINTSFLHVPKVLDFERKLLFSALLTSDFFFQAEDGIRDRSPSRGLGDVYKRQVHEGVLKQKQFLFLSIDSINSKNESFKRRFSMTRCILGQQYLISRNAF